MKAEPKSIAFIEKVGRSFLFRAVVYVLPVFYAVRLVLMIVTPQAYHLPGWRALLWQGARDFSAALTLFCWQGYLRITELGDPRSFSAEQMPGGCLWFRDSMQVLNCHRFSNFHGYLQFVFPRLWGLLSMFGRYAQSKTLKLEFVAKSRHSRRARSIRVQPHQGYSRVSARPRLSHPGRDVFQCPYAEALIYFQRERDRIQRKIVHGAGRSRRRRHGEYVGSRRRRGLSWL